MKFNFNTIKKKNQPYIIAEVGVNHECYLALAKKLILQAKYNGAQAVKFQTYKAEKLAKINSKAYWDTSKEKTKSQFELFSKYDKFNKSDYKNLSSFCKKNKIDFLSTPFDLESVDIIKNLVSVFKISSSDITNFPLLRKIANTKKPVIISTGASNLDEIRYAINILKKKTSKIVIMHCILNYPTKNEDANLKMISSLKKEFPNYVIGYSDHTMPDNNMTNITTAFILGAKVIEKHFTHDKNLKGNDHYHSMDFRDLKNLSRNLKKIIKILGPFSIKKAIKSELKSRKFARRSIVANKNLKKGSKIKDNDLIGLRPNIGISTIFWKKVIGKKVKRNLKKGQTLNWTDFY